MVCRRLALAPAKAQIECGTGTGVSRADAGCGSQVEIDSIKQVIVFLHLNLALSYRVDKMKIALRLFVLFAIKACAVAVGKAVRLSLILAPNLFMWHELFVS